MANKVVLHTPIKSEDIENLKIGDIVYLTGKITTCRDVAHRRLIEEGRKLPVDLEGGAMLALSSVLSKARKMPMKWFPLDLPLPCGWKNSKRISFPRPA